MILTNIEIINLTEGLVTFKQDNSNILPIKIGFNIIKNIKILTPIYESIIEMRNDIIQKYANNDLIEENKLDIINAELLELGNLKNEIDINKISLNDISEVKISLDLLDKISIIIDEDI